MSTINKIPLPWWLESRVLDSEPEQSYERGNSKLFVLLFHGYSMVTGLDTDVFRGFEDPRAYMAAASQQPPPSQISPGTVAPDWLRSGTPGKARGRCM